MIKDSFQVSDCEPSINKTWVSFLPQEIPLSKKNKALLAEDNFNKNEETVISKKLISEDHTKTCPKYDERQLWVYEKNEKQPIKHILYCGVVSVGRGKDNQISILDPKASRKHFVLEIKPDRVELKDFSSENGTKVNNVKAHHHVLKNKDKIEVGETTFIFHVNLFDERTERELSTQKVRKEGKKLRQLAFLKKIREQASTVGIIFFFVVATSCLVLGGAMMGKIFQEESMRRMFAFNEKLHMASHVAAFGNITQAKILLNEASQFSKKNNLQTNEYYSVASFISIMQKINQADRFFLEGNLNQALLKLKEIDFSNLSREESLYAQDAVKDRFRNWQYYYESKKVMNQKSSPAQKHKSVNLIKSKKISAKSTFPGETWKQAIELYKNGKISESCSLVKRISVMTDKNLAEKAVSFWERKCEH